MFPTLFTFGFFTFALGRQFLDDFPEFLEDVSSAWNLRCWYTMNRFSCCFQHFVFTEFCVKMRLTKKKWDKCQVEQWTWLFPRICFESRKLTFYFDYINYSTSSSINWIPGSGNRMARFKSEFVSSGTSFTLGTLGTSSPETFWLLLGCGSSKHLMYRVGFKYRTRQPLKLLAKHFWQFHLRSSIYNVRPSFWCILGLFWPKIVGFRATDIH